MAIHTSQRLTIAEGIALEWFRKHVTKIGVGTLVCGIVAILLANVQVTLFRVAIATGLCMYIVLLINVIYAYTKTRTPARQTHRKDKLQSSMVECNKRIAHTVHMLSIGQIPQTYDDLCSQADWLRLFLTVPLTGATPLHHAVNMGNTANVLRFLLRFKGMYNINARNFSGATAIQLALDSDNLDGDVIVMLLVAFGAQAPASCAKPTPRVDEPLLPSHKFDATWARHKAHECFLGWKDG